MRTDKKHHKRMFKNWYTVHTYFKLDVGNAWLHLCGFDERINT